ncbi:MAG: excinuclease ABC subunit UvrA [Bacteroidales bacterium]|nr:excinuclease ABC subunit UvrA [Bacteroidales bacterium]
MKIPDPKDYIFIKGARVHNLKNIDVQIPRNKLIVITGLSGSGKSSLAFDTLYADGQRRYVESLSSYARQFLGRMSKPEVDMITGISPAIAIEQKVNTRNPRSTVGTSTEIYEYLKLLFARIGKTYSPVSGKEVKRHSVEDATNFIIGHPEGTEVRIMAPLLLKQDRSVIDHLNVLHQQGFSRIVVKGELIKITEAFELNNIPKSAKDIYVLVDRIITHRDDSDLQTRIADSVQTAFYEGDGSCTIEIKGSKACLKHFSNRFELDGISFEEPSVNLFTFNNPYGACKSCEGFGSIIGIDPDLVIPNKGLSVYEDAIACWKGEKMGQWKQELISNAHKFDFPVHKPIFELSDKEYMLLWTGNEYFDGLDDFFTELEEQTYKIQYRVMLSRYRGKTTCPECNGTRLRKDANYVRLDSMTISDAVMMPVDILLEKVRNLKLRSHDQKVGKRLIIEISNRLQYLADVGLGYLNMNRLSSSLSGGESQRINLATSLGSSLVGSMYILDEPSIGLHPRDTYRLIHILKQLRDLGNTVIVVEHDQDIIRSADHIIDIGPMAGSMGGELMFSGPYKKLIEDKASLTARYMNGSLKMSTPEKRRKWREFIRVHGAMENNLKNFDVSFPLNVMTVVTGVSGSGKSSLVSNILFPSLKKRYGGYAGKTGKYMRLSGDIDRVHALEFVDQNPIGRSSRSNPATYIKAFDDIRSLFADQQVAMVRNYKPGFFSFNVPGGRCEECEGEGVVKIEMQFMADIYLKCDHCSGKRFKEEILEIRFREKNISDILNLTIDEAVAFFEDTLKHTAAVKRIITRLKPLQDVGLGYLKMGQSSSTLSGGEAQRIKLAFFLSRGSHEAPTLFIFDEPTTGLHFHDINNLLNAFNALLDAGHTVLIIEHNQEIIKAADWIIDLGPEGGDKGGTIVFEGTPEEIVNNKDSYTGEYLKGLFDRN